MFPVSVLWSQDSSVSIVTGLRGGRPGFHSRREHGIFSLRHRVQTGSGADQASFSMDTMCKADGAWRWPLTSI